jgi:hypothetical protein
MEGAAPLFAGMALGLSERMNLSAMDCVVTVRAQRLGRT